MSTHNSKNKLLSNLQIVENLAKGSMWHRLSNHPYKYIKSQLIRRILFPLRGMGTQTQTITFYNTEIDIDLPSATDIYLTKGKSHPSEILLARYMIQELRQDMTFVDIGAHYGYFTLLAAQLTDHDNIFAIEPAPKTFKLLSQNTSKSSIPTFNFAVSDQEGTLTFYEFPSLYNEYNAIDIDKYKSEPWYQNNPPIQHNIPTITLDAFVKKHDIQINMIKIDVEGAEEKVILGAKETFRSQSPKIILEILPNDNKPHLSAITHLQKWGYLPHQINQNGSIDVIPDIDNYINKQLTDSENLVFSKK